MQKNRFEYRLKNSFNIHLENIMNTKLFTLALLLFVFAGVSAQEKTKDNIYSPSDYGLETGNVYDLLELIPQVSVSEEGTLSILGNGSAQVTINNRIVSAGGEYQATLEQLSLELVEYVEVISTPSAKHDAEAAGGIVNIMLEGDGLTGTSGNLNTKFKTENKYDLSAGVNTIKGKWNVKLDASAQQFYTQTKSQIHTKNYYLNDTIINFQELIHAPLFNRVNASLNIDYAISPFQNIVLNSTFGKTKLKVDTDITNQSHDENDDYSYTNRRNDKGNNNQVSLEYKNQLSKDKKLKRELSAMASYYVSETGRISDLQMLYQDITATDLFHANAQIDYLHELNSTQNLELGVRSFARDTRMDYNRDSIDEDEQIYPLLVDLFNYNEKVHGTYVQWNASFATTNINIGLRAEYSTSNGVQELAQTNLEKDYLHLFPSLKIMHPLNDKHKLIFNYNRNIHRPQIHQVNPFVNDANPNNIQYGNPDLDPALTDNFELKYQGDLELNKNEKTLNHNWYFSLIWREKHDEIYRAALSSDEQSGVIENSFYNLQRGYDFAIEAFYGAQITVWWKLDLIPSFRYTHQDGRNINAEIIGESKVFSIKANSNMDFWKGSRFTVSSFYRGAHESVQGELGGFGRTTYSLRQLFLDKKLSLTLAVRDPFNSPVFNNDFIQDDFYQQRSFMLESPIYEISIRYNFGQFKSPEKQQMNDAPFIP